MNDRYQKEILSNKYGKLTPIKYAGRIPKSSRALYLCKCDCGKEKIIRSDCLRSGATISCGCVRLMNPENKKWRGFGEIYWFFWAKIFMGARSRKLEVDIDIKYIWDLFLKQERKCALSKLELTFPKRRLNFSYTASLDRIDSSKGYIKGNVQWVHKKINFMKSSYSQEEFIDFCKLIAQNN